MEKWDGEYKAVKDGSMCPQRDPFVHSYADEGVEDCLYLNVYAPHAVKYQFFLKPKTKYFILYFYFIV